jgi:hypothetical protein
MTSRQRKAWKLLYVILLPLGVLAIDAYLYVSMRGWTYYVRKDGAATFWPAALALGAFFFPLAAGLLAKACLDMWNARASAHWPIADGRVTDTRIEEEEYSRRGWIGYDTYYEYLPKVAYTYEAAGRSWSNNLTAFGLSAFKSRAEAEQMLRGYAKGAPVRVRYDPDDPAISVLQSSGGWALKAIGAALMLVIIPFGVAFTLVTSG